MDIKLIANLKNKSKLKNVVKKYFQENFNKLFQKLAKVLDTDELKNR
jgi:hypothetical protein